MVTLDGSIHPHSEATWEHLQHYQRCGPHPIWQAKCCHELVRSVLLASMEGFERGSKIAMKQLDDTITIPDGVVLDPGKPLPGCIPILPVRDVVLFPFSMVPITVGRSGSLKLLEDLRGSSVRFVGVLAQREAGKDNPQPDELFSMGTVAIVIKEIRLKDEGRIIFVQG
jgi:hypothetical protein